LREAFDHSSLVPAYDYPQLMQRSVRCSTANMIWHYPGFPSLLVTLCRNDFFFSGHTAIAVFGAMSCPDCAEIGSRLGFLAGLFRSGHSSDLPRITRWTFLLASPQRSDRQPSEGSLPLDRLIIAKS